MTILPFSSAPISNYVPTFNVKTYGATGNGTTDDTTAINTALGAANSAGGGQVFVPQGTYKISAPLVIYSNTYFELGTATISLAANSNCNMLIDYSHSVNNLTVPSTMNNISVNGGIWNRNNNNGSNNNTHSIILGGNHISIENAQFLSTNGKYAVMFQNALNFRACNLFMNNTNSDGVHMNGPLAGGYIHNIYGTTRDDLVSITPNDYAVYSWGNEGDVTDIVIDSIFPVACTTNAVKVLGGTTTNGTVILNTNRITIRNVSGTMTSAAETAIYIGDDIVSPNTQGGQIDEVLIDGLAVTFPNTSTQSLVLLNGSSVTRTIPKLKICNVNIASDMNNVFTNYQALVTSLILDNVSGYTATKPVLSVVYVNAALSTVSRLEASNWDLTFAGSNSGNNNGEAVRATNASAVLTEVNMSNIYLSNGGSLAHIATSTTFRLANIHLAGNIGVLNVLSGATVVVSGASGITADTNTSSITSTGTVQSLAVGFPLDITNAQVVTNKGNMAYNIAAGASTGIGPVAYNGSAWQPIALTQSLYTTSSPTFAKLNITTGSNANAGTATLSGGTVTVSTTAVTSNSLIFLTDATGSLTNVGSLSVTSKTAGTSFTVNSTNALDISTFNWIIIN